MRSVNSRDRIDWHAFNYEPETDPRRVLLAALLCFGVAFALVFYVAIVVAS